MLTESMSEIDEPEVILEEEGPTEASVAPPIPVALDVTEELDEAAYYAGQGLRDDARHIYEAILRAVPGEQTARTRLNELLGIKNEPLPEEAKTLEVAATLLNGQKYREARRTLRLTPALSALLETRIECKAEYFYLMGKVYRMEAQKSLSRFSKKEIFEGRGLEATIGYARKLSIGKVTSRDGLRLAGAGLYSLLSQHFFDELKKLAPNYIEQRQHSSGRIPLF